VAMLVPPQANKPRIIIMLVRVTVRRTCCVISYEAPLNSCKSHTLRTNETAILRCVCGGTRTGHCARTYTVCHVAEYKAGMASEHVCYTRPHSYKRNVTSSTRASWCQVSRCWRAVLTSHYIAGIIPHDTASWHDDAMLLQGVWA
jgi:hypothetical protein